jgi:regulator of protease activity HflC (stomatin/prohibitin superfamily)
MAEIRNSFIWFRHLRSEASSHVVQYRRGRKVRSGKGLSFRFSPRRNSLVEVPLDDRDVDFVVQTRSRDFQQVTVQGTVTWRASNIETLAERVDFSLNLKTGLLRAEPLDRIASLLIGLVQQHAASHVETHPASELLEEGSGPLQSTIETVLSRSDRLGEMGIAIVAVRLAHVSPSAELSRALATPTFERAQQQADEATFSRRALAVEKERAIAENELSTKIELARRQSALIEQEDDNKQREARGQVEVGRIAAEAAAERTRTVETAQIEMERARLAIVQDVNPSMIYALAARAFAEKLSKIDTLNVTPDLAAAIGQMLRGAREG